MENRDNSRSIEHPLRTVTGKGNDPSYGIRHATSGNQGPDLRDLGSARAEETGRHLGPRVVAV